ncbi:MAG: ABC transporter permease [Pseudobdellovibrionaceae bacterium]
MKKMLIIAQTTLLELFRDRFFYVMFFVGIFVILLSLLFGAMSFDERNKMIVDFGYGAVQISVLVLGLVLGSSIIAKEVERQTCLLILARPVSRWQFLMGKYFGILAVFFVNILVLNFVILFLVGDWSKMIHSFVICLSLFLECSTVLSFVFLMSMFVRPVIAMLGGFSLFLIGHWLPDMQYFAKKSQNVEFQAIADALMWVVPQFFQFNWKNYFFFLDDFKSSDVYLMTLHCVSWSSIALLLATILFRRKDIV